MVTTKEGDADTLSAKEKSSHGRKKPRKGDQKTDATTTKGRAKTRETPLKLSDHGGGENIIRIRVWVEEGATTAVGPTTVEWGLTE